MLEIYRILFRQMLKTTSAARCAISSAKCKRQYVAVFVGSWLFFRSHLVLSSQIYLFNKSCNCACISVALVYHMCAHTVVLFSLHSPASKLPSANREIFFRCKCCRCCPVSWRLPTSNAWSWKYKLFHLISPSMFNNCCINEWNKITFFIYAKPQFARIYTDRCAFFLIGKFGGF